jgi:adenine-specific DNA-methyltransferase
MLLIDAMNMDAVPKESKRAISTEGVKYTGSKKTIIPAILRLLDRLPVRRVMDGFSGTTRVSQALKLAGYEVICNDIAVWSRVFGECYLLNRKPAAYYQKMIDHLNGLEGKAGWYTENYGGMPNEGSSIQEDGRKRIWQFHNTMKLDAVREEIDQLTSDAIERSVLLTSLMLAMDRVDSSLGHHASYLRDWAPRSYTAMRMTVPGFVPDNLPHEVTQADVFSLVHRTDVDLTYFDPPYGSSNTLMPPSRVRYASYYHLWKTVCVNDRPPLVGAARRRSDASDTVEPNVFEEFRRSDDGRYIAMRALEQLLAQTRARFVLLSYSNGGRATCEDLLSTIERLGFDRVVIGFQHKEHVMGAMVWTGKWVRERILDFEGHREYLILMSREGIPRNFGGRALQEML